MKLKIKTPPKKQLILGKHKNKNNKNKYIIPYYNFNLTLSSLVFTRFLSLFHFLQRVNEMHMQELKKQAYINLYNFSKTFIALPNPKSLPFHRFYVHSLIQLAQAKLNSISL